MKLLIIGRLDGHITTASQIAMSRGAKVSQIDSIEAGLEALRAGQGAELVMCDVALDLGELIRSLAAERISVPVVACGLSTDPDLAVEAIKAGAKEYVPLPPDPELIAAVLEAVAEERHELVFKDPSMGQVLKLAEQVAPSEASILITGESGTGKEIMARYIHRHSKRVEEAFVAVNCAAIPENLLESELFGHEKGAFTGAVARRVGRFEEAHGGTLLLDEVSEMDPRLQAKLLRVIQEREVSRVGGNAPFRVDVRLIATTNRNLADEVAKGTFREDLFYRLNVVNLSLPALRERPADVELLAEHFIAKYAEANGVPKLPLSMAARQELQDHAWRGNVRELENTMHRAVLLAQGEQIRPEDVLLTDLGELPGDANGGAQEATATHAAAASGAARALAGAETKALVGRTVAEVERELIIDTLKHCLGNRTHAANILGISIRTLRNKLKAYADDGVAVPLPGESPTRAAM